MPCLQSGSRQFSRICKSTRQKHLQGPLVRPFEVLEHFENADLLMHTNVGKLGAVAVLQVGRGDVDDASFPVLVFADQTHVSFPFVFVGWLWECLELRLW